jgi:hypothetical protein
MKESPGWFARFVPSDFNSTKLIEESLSVFEIACVEALGEPAIDLGEQIARLVATGRFREQPGEAHGCPQFPKPSPCSPAMLNAFAIQFLGGLGITRPAASARRPKSRPIANPPYCA